ncbi:hypothetical protein NEOC65_001419, partial [Neochlamydia sp. AcF65]|nr:hypothetical protein [Neochlamydia sp. AcF65]
FLSLTLSIAGKIFITQLPMDLKEQDLLRILLNIKSLKVPFEPLSVEILKFKLNINFGKESLRYPFAFR